MSRLVAASARAWLAGLALLAVFGVASVAVWSAESTSRAGRQRSQERIAERALTESVGAVLAHERQLAALIGVLHTPVGPRWPVFAQTLMSDPATSATGLIVPVPERDVAAFERAHGLRLVSVPRPGVVVAAPRRAMHWVLLDHRRKPGSPRARLGLDLAANPVRRRFLARAAATGTPEATPPVRFLSPGRAQFGVIVFEVVRTPAGRLRGWVTASYNAAELTDAVAQRVPGVHLRVADGNQLLVDDGRVSGGLRAVTAVAGRQWTIAVRVAPGPVSAVPWLLLLLGGLTGVGVVAVLGSSAGRERYALELVDEHVAAERARQVELEDQRRQLAEAQALAQLGSWELDLSTNRSRWSDELCRILGHPAGFAPTFEEFLAMVHPDDVAALTGRVDEAKGSLFSDSEYRILRSDGEVRHVHTRRFGRAGPDGALTHLWGTTQDVTDRRCAELEAHQAREHAEAITAAMAEGYALTIEGRIAAVNDMLCEMTGFAREELIDTTPPYLFWPPETLTETVALRDRVLESEGATFELTLMRKDGSRFEAELTARPARDPDGSVLGFVTTVRDVSDHKRHAAELDRERRDLNQAQAVARVGSWDYDLIADQPGRWSRELWQMLGLDPRPQAPPLDEFFAMIHPGDRPRVRDAIMRACTGDDPWDGEFRMLTGDGRELIVSFRAEHAHDPHGRKASFYGTLQDITERAQREREAAALREIAQLVAQAAGPSAVFEQVARQLLGLFDAHSGIVARFDESSGQAVFVRGTTHDGRSLTGITLELDGESAPASVYRTQGRQPHRRRSLDRDQPRARVGGRGRSGMRSPRRSSSRDGCGGAWASPSPDGWPPRGHRTTPGTPHRAGRDGDRQRRGLGGAGDTGVHRRDHRAGQSPHLPGPSAS